jgi:hypothetical protein
MSAPDRQALALAFLEVAPAHDSPARVAGEHPRARVHLVVDVGKASEARQQAEDLHESRSSESSSDKSTDEVSGAGSASSA